jgi:hypothetical protein
MTIRLRAATPADVDTIVALSEQKRMVYAAYQPVFWHTVMDSAAAQIPLSTDVVL